MQRVGVSIDSNIWTDFRAFVRLKHGRIHGVLALEVENSLKLLMEKDENCRKENFLKESNTKSIKIPSHTLKQEIKIIRIIKEHYEDNAEICFKHLCKLIIESTDLLDERTHKKYVNSLVAKEILIENPPISEKYECYTLNLRKSPPI